MIILRILLSLSCFALFSTESFAMKRKAPDENSGPSKKQKTVTFDDSTKKDSLTENRSISITLDQQRFAQQASLYGNKTANLDAMNCFAQEYNKLGYGFTVVIPSFVAIASQQTPTQVQNIGSRVASWMPQIKNMLPSSVAKIVIAPQSVYTLLKDHGLDLATEWQKIISTTCLNKNEILETKKLPDAFLQSAEQLANNVDALFGTLARDHVSTLDFETISFINNAAKNNTMLIVRSTGKEDTEDVANAGGNQTVPNVQPTEANVLKACGNVVSSYLRSKSLIQRCNAGDKTIFDLPFVPVLIQEMITEPQAGLAEAQEIPQCGVMYTTERQTDMNGIMHCEITYGNNEAVVDPVHQGRVAHDTFYVSKNSVQAMIKEKKERLVPTEKGLDYTQNPELLVSTPAVHHHTLHNLYTLAHELERYYGQPQDVEFIINHNDKVINLVQSRPYQKRRFTIEPQYITSLASIDPNNIVRGTPCIIADCKVRVITNPAQIIIHETMAGALDAYEKNSVPNAVALIRQPGGILSHQGAILASENVITLVTDQLETLHAWLKQDNLCLLVDIQRGVVINATGYAMPEISNGWLNHPIVIDESITSWNQKNTVRCLLDKVLAHFPDDLSKEDLPFLSAQEITNLLELVKEGDTAAIEQSLITLLCHVYALIYRQQYILYEEKPIITRQVPEDEGMTVDTGEPETLTTRTILDLAPLHHAHLDELNKLFHHMLATSNQILQQRTHAPRSLQRLYPTASFERSLTGNASINSVHSYSALSATHNHQALCTFVKDTIAPLAINDTTMQVLVNNSTFLGIAHEGYSAANTPELGNLWISFIARLAADQTNHGQFLAMYALIKNLDVLPWWMNISFYQASKSLDTCLTSLIQEFKNSEHALKNLQLQKTVIAGINHLDWDNPDHVTKQLPGFINNTIKSFTTGIYADRDAFAAQSPLMQCATACLMNTFVDLFDSIIKTVKIRKNVTIVRQMVQVFFSLVEPWAHLIPDGGMTYHENYAINRYVAYVKNILVKRTISEDELVSSADFSVLPAALGATTALDRHLRFNSTLEDCFTLTHQSLLNIVNALMTPCIDKLLLPKNLADFDIALKKVNLPSQARTSQPLVMKLIGVSCSKNTIELLYNLPLRNHSSQFKLIYSKKSNTIELDCRFFGPRPQRFHNILTYLKITGLFEEFIVRNDSVNNNGLLCRLYFKDTFNPTILDSWMNEANDMTFTEDDSIPQGLLEKINTKALAHIDFSQIPINEFTTKFIANFFIALIEKDYQPVLNRASRLVLNYFRLLTRDDLEYEGLELFVSKLLSLLAEKNHQSTINEVITLIDSMIDDAQLSLACIQLFNTLVKGKYTPIFKKAFAFVEKTIENTAGSKNNFLSDIILQILENFIDNDYTPSYNIATSKAYQQIKESTSTNTAHSIFAKLFEKNHAYAFEEALKLAKDLGTNCSWYGTAMDQFSILHLMIQHNYIPGFDYAIDVATSLDWLFLGRLTNSISILSALFKKNYEPSLDAGLKAAKKLITQTNTTFNKGGVDLFNLLFQEDYKPAFDAATEALTDNDIRDESIRTELESLLKKHSKS